MFKVRGNFTKLTRVQRTPFQLVHSPASKYYREGFLILLFVLKMIPSHHHRGPGYHDLKLMTQRGESWPDGPHCVSFLQSPSPHSHHHNHHRHDLVPPFPHFVSISITLPSFHLTLGDIPELLLFPFWVSLLLPSQSPHMILRLQSRVFSLPLGLT